ncbi:hypothetical protein C8T65DRAFT_72915 [Cerioporus squamosus]|nr:hypothetical protein C8T65DRAFT_72915 [Cerioporus squamosus]
MRSHSHHAAQSGSSSRSQPEAAIHRQGQQDDTTCAPYPPPSTPSKGSASGLANSSSRRGRTDSSPNTAVHSPATKSSQKRVRLEAPVNFSYASWPLSKAVPIPLPSRDRSLPCSSKKPQSRTVPSQYPHVGSASIGHGASAHSRAGQTGPEAHPPSVQPEHSQPRSSTQQDPAPPSAVPVFPPLSARSAEFWYPDGNSIVVVDGTYFRLLQSRLERHCGYFTDRPWSIVNGQKVVEVQDLKLRDFETFLRYMEIPIRLRGRCSVPSAGVPRPLVQSHRRPHQHSSIRAVVLCVSPAPGDELAGRPYGEALHMLRLTHAIDAPLVRKQALYALLSDDQFWSDSRSKRADVDIASDDLVMLYHVRALMQEKWRVHALTPPKQCQDAECLADGGARKALWRGQMAEYTAAEVRDPIREVTGVRTAIGELGTWCRVCLDERARAWEVARDLWWDELDQLLGIVVSAERHG